MNRDEKISNPIVDLRQPFPQGLQRDNFDKLNETITFSDLTTDAFGGGNPGFNGPWDFDQNDEGFRSGLYAGSKGNTAEITNWGEDQDYNGILDGATFCLTTPGTSCTCSGGIYPCGSGTPRGGSDCPSSDRCLTGEDFDGDRDGTLDEGWGLGGGCGFMSSSGPANRGVWHTGQIGAVGATSCTGNTFPVSGTTTSVACENIDTVPGTSGRNFWVEFLRTPVIRKVHKNPDGRGINYRVQLGDWRWNVNADYEPDNVQFTWEFDEDTTSLDPVDLGDGYIMRAHNDGLGPINGDNVNLYRGFPMFVENDPDDDSPGFGQKKVFGCITGPNLNAACSCTQGLVICNDATDCGAGNQCGIIQNGMNGRNRKGDRGCMFENLTAAQVSVTTALLREPGPVDNDCDNDIVSLGPDGCPGYCGVDDDGDAAADNPEEACPCFGKADGIDDDLDGRADEGDEVQRFYRCKGNTSQYCIVTGVNSDSCSVGQGPCGRYGNGKPIPYGDDVCGDGSVDESTSDKWAAETALGENGHRIAQNQNFNISMQGGPYLRFTPLEDYYDREAGESFQGAIGFEVFEGSPRTSQRTPTAWPSMI